jgi:ferredoxin
MSQQLVEDFIRLFELPPAMVPYLSYVADEQEMKLVVGLNGRSMTVGEIAALMGMSLEDAEAFAKKCFTRCILARHTQDGVHVYSAETFYRRLDPISMFEQWGDVPADARNEVIRWQLQEFISKYTPAIEEIQKNPDAYVRIPNRDVMLLSEALEAVDAATEHAVTLCDCRTIVMACNREVEACIRLNEGATATVERGMGRKLTREECHQLVIDLDRKGLMHTGDRSWKERGTNFGFCSCCACDCYPIMAGISLGMQKQWPRCHYVAVFDEAKCNQCGQCVNRCHFSAFHHTDERVKINSHEVKRVALDQEKCWGCGLCSTGCPNGAITMQPLAETATAEPTEVRKVSFDEWRHD